LIVNQKYSKNGEILLQSILNILYSCNQSWIFSIITPVFSSVSHDPSEIMLICRFVQL